MSTHNSNTNFETVYAGWGKEKKGPTFSTIEVNLNMEDLERLSFEYNGKRYVKIEIVPRRRVDQFGRTHIAKWSVKVPQNEDALADEQEMVTADHRDMDQVAELPIPKRTRNSKK